MTGNSWHLLEKHCLEAHEAELLNYLVSAGTAAVNRSCECPALHSSWDFACVSTPVCVCALWFYIMIFLFKIFLKWGVCFVCCWWWSFPIKKSYIYWRRVRHCCVVHEATVPFLPPLYRGDSVVIQDRWHVGKILCLLFERENIPSVLFCFFPICDPPLSVWPRPPWNYSGTPMEATLQEEYSPL